MSDEIKKYIFLHKNGNYYFQKRTPSSVLRIDPSHKKKEMISLKTDDLKTALIKAEKINHALLEDWTSVSANNDPGKQYDLARRRVQDLDLKYLLNDDLIQQDQFTSLVNRIAFLEKRTESPQSLNTQALLGGIEKPLIKLSDVLNIYFDEIKVETKKSKTSNQYRIWKNPKMKAVLNFIEINGDIDFYSINRQHANLLRTFWMERILNEEVTGHTAKKDFNNLSVICSDYANHIGDFDFKNPFANVKFDQTKSKVRPPFSIQMIDELINTELFKTVNFEARMAFMASVDTGLRPSEITRLRKENIFLDGSTPYVFVTDTEVIENNEIKTKSLKTSESEREVPLVGVALEAFKACPNGFPKYFNKENALCAALNKFLRVNNFKPTKMHSFYSLRHSFTDRMEEAGLGEEFRHRMTGHTNKHVVYGKGGALAFKHQQLLKIVRSKFNESLFKDC